MDKERDILRLVAAIAAFSFFCLDLFLNYRISNQLGYSFHPDSMLMSDHFKSLSVMTMNVFGHLGTKHIVFLMSLVVWFLALLTGMSAVYKPDRVLHKSVYVVCAIGTGFFFILGYFNPFINYFGDIYPFGFPFYACVKFGLFLMLVNYFSKWGKTIQFFQDAEDGSGPSIDDDPFGRVKRYFPQMTEKLENLYSVNIQYKFNSVKGLVNGWINIINPFRGVLVMGPPGSGKTYGTFLPGIYQFIMKGFTMVVYDFKFSDLTEYTYWCYLEMVERANKSKGLIKKIFYSKVLPEFCIFNLDLPLYSERCNVFQPHNLNMFTDALALMKAFLIALNPSWKNKEGDFFPESAINFATLCTWMLNCYTPRGGKKGDYCSLPHLIELVSQDVDSVVTMALKMKDSSMSNVVKPFEEAKRDGALEQLQGQLGTVRISLSRMTSPNVYYLLTEEEGSEPFDLRVNSKKKPKILSLANSGQNAGVNNIVLSLFLVQISRFVNEKGRNPLALKFDEAVTLSYPKSTIDALVATGRSRLISVWLGIQDKEQLTRDLGRETADALFNMMGNYFVGNVRRDTAKWISEEVGLVRVLEKNKSVSAKGEVSYSYSEKEVQAVPPSFVSDMSQGTMVGKLSDDIDQKLKYKAFYGEIQFDHPFKEKQKKKVPVYKNGELTEVEKEVLVDKDMPQLPYSKYWQKVLRENCEGMDAEQINEFVKKLMDINFKRVVSDVARMKAELLDESYNEDQVLKDALERMAQGEEASKEAEREWEEREREIAMEEPAAA